MGNGKPFRALGGAARRIRDWPARVAGAAEGAVAVEAALVMTALSLLLLGVIDFGLAYAQQMAMSNAVRAGTQFALVRHPSLGPEAAESEALSSLASIRAAVVDSAQAFVSGDPGPDRLEVRAVCLCPDGTEVTCTPAPGTPPVCQVETHVRVALALPYALTLRFPGVLETITIRAQHSVRLN